jgi:hypothetical protein
MFKLNILLGYHVMLILKICVANMHLVFKFWIADPTLGHVPFVVIVIKKDHH